MVVKNAFGRLKGRWRCLLKQNEVDITKMNSIVITCCVLQNICDIFKETFVPDLTVQRDHHADPITNVTVNRRIKDAEEIRNSLVQYCQDTDI